MKLSVIIPAYNRAALIGETLRSLLNQTLPADEILVVDDGSTDETAEVVRQTANNWTLETGKLKPEIRVILQENAGPAAARNTGFRASRGEFIHFFDSDDLAALNKQEVQLRALQASGADIAYGPWVKGSFEGKSFRPENHVLQQRGLPQGDLVKTLLTSWSIVPHACLFRRSIVEKSGGFPEDLFVGEDQFMFLNCLLAGAKVVHSPGTLELYRLHDADKITAAGEGQRRQVEHWSQFLVNADEACHQHGINTRDWFGFRRRAWEALEDLKTFGIDNEDLIQRLREIKGGVTPDVIYQLHRAVERKLLGLKMRLIGFRDNSTFRSGPITEAQIALVKELGFSSYQMQTRSWI
jgi:hypothetical protein